MAKRKFKSANWPNDSFIQYERIVSGERDCLKIEIGLRYMGKRNFDYLLIELTHDEAVKMIDRVARDLGLKVVPA